MVAFAPGDVLAGRFEVLRRLGSGGLAEVFVARDRVAGNDVAVKALHAHLAEDGGLAERFRREMSITRGLDDPGIVRVFDLYEHEGRPFLSMELLEGETLADRLHKGPLPAEEARRIARDICRSLRFAHQAGVIHRDLKPQNVFLTRAGLTKLLDFGLARVAGQARLTSATAVMGTPGYIAPELIAGQRPDPRCDLYALGATFFEMLTGHRAFSSSDPYEAARQQREQIPQARSVNPNVTDADEMVLRRALEPDPERRFLDASQMLRALGGEPVPPAPATPPPMTAGEYDVLVHDVIKPQHLWKRPRPIDEVLDRLGAHAGRSWKLRLAGAGQGVLVTGASKRTAEGAAAICAEEGLPATVRPAAARPRFEGFLARHGGWLSALIGAGCGPALAVIMGWEPQLWIGIGVATGYVLSWGFQPGAAQAPLSGFPAQDSGMARLADGIARRVERLKDRGRLLPESHQKVLADLMAAAHESATLARQFSQTTPVPEPSQSPDDAPTLPPGALRALELLTHRLLEIATALDDALAIADRRGESSGVLKRLAEDAALAQHALPDLRRLKPGETPPVELTRKS